MAVETAKSAAPSARRHVADVIYEAASRVASSRPIESQLEDLPALSLYTFVTSLLTLGNRVVKLGKLELGLAELVSWQRPAMTLTFLFTYSLLCYHPQWIVMLPLFYFVGFVLVPNYADRFKLDAVAASEASKDGALGLELDSCAAPAIRAAKEKEQQVHNRNMLTAIRQGQHALSRIVKALDKFDEFRNGPARFEDIQSSCIMLLAATAALVAGTYGLSFVSIPRFFSMLGWSVVCAKHPLAKLTSKKLEDFHIEPQLEIEVLRERFRAFCARTVLVDDKPLSLSVEIFELQPMGLTARQWDYTKTVWSTDPYLLGSKVRSRKQWPQGPDSSSDVLAPKGWYFDITDSWEVDNAPSQWVGTSRFEDALLRKKIRVEPDSPWVYDQSSEGAFEDDKRVWRRRRLTRTCYYELR